MILPLPEHEVLIYQRKLQGQTHPYLVAIDAEEGAVVKLICKHGCVCLKEYLAICLAQSLNLKTLMPLQANISTDFIESLPEHEPYTHAFRSHHGPAFATYYQSGMLTPIAADFFEQAVQQELLVIFCFDLLIRNFDRTLSNPNLLVRQVNKQKELWVIDHEMAFPYSFETSSDSPLWTLSIEERLKIQAHCAYKPLREMFKQNYADWSQMLLKTVQQYTRFTASSSIWLDVWLTTPLFWREKDEYARIKTRISAVSTHTTEMFNMIREVLTL